MAREALLCVRDMTLEELNAPVNFRGNKVKFGSGQTWIYWAFHHGDLYVINDILNRIHDTMLPPTSKLIDTICRHDNVEILKLILPRVPYESLLGDDDSNSKPALHIAAAHGAHDTIVFLLGYLKSEDVNGVFGKTANTALHVACMCKDPSTIRLLLSAMDYNAIHATDAHKRTAFYHAVYTDNMDCVIPFFDCMDITDAMRTTALFRACVVNNTALSSLVLPNMNINGKTLASAGMTYLHIACKAGSADVARQLLSACNVVATDIHGNTALHTLCRANVEEKDVAKYLATSRILIDAMDANDLALLNDEGETALKIACIFGGKFNARLLIPRMELKDLSTVCDKAWTPLMTACRFGRAEAIKMLVGRLGVEALMESNPSVQNGTTPAHRAFYVGRRDIVRTILRLLSVSDLEITDKVGNTSLHIVCSQYEQLDGVCCSMIVGKMHRKALSLRNNRGDTALHIAARGRTIHSVRILIENMNPSDIEILNNDGRSALHEACAGARTAIVREVMRKLDPSQWRVPQRDGKTPRDLFYEQSLIDGNTFMKESDVDELFPIAAKNACSV